MSILTTEQYMSIIITQAKLRHYRQFPSVSTMMRMANCSYCDGKGCIWCPR